MRTEQQDGESGPMPGAAVLCPLRRCARQETSEGAHSSHPQPLHNLGEGPPTQPSTSLNDTWNLLLSCLKVSTYIHPSGISLTFPQPFPILLIILISPKSMTLFSIYLMPVFSIAKPLFIRVTRKRRSTFLKICDLNQIIPLQPKPSRDSMQNSREITCLNSRIFGMVS